MSDDRIVSTLNKLVETCRDGERGLRTAARSVTDAHIRQLFLTYADQRAQFAAELQAEVRRLGGEAETGGSVAGSLHRGWMGLKSAVTGGDVQSIVGEAERGEDSAKTAYEEALQEAAMTGAVRALVERQYARVKYVHDQIKALRPRAA